MPGGNVDRALKRWASHWVTVIICRLLGGFITGFLGAAVLAGLLITNPAGTTAPQSALVTYSLVVTVLSAAVIGLVRTGLLPRCRAVGLSGCRVSLGTAMLAAFAGQMVPFIGGAFFTNALLSRQGAYSRGAASGGPRHDLYSRARQTSLDDPPEP